MGGVHMSIRDPPKKKSVCRSRQGHGIWEKEGVQTAKTWIIGFALWLCLGACQRPMDADLFEAASACRRKATT